MKLDGPVSSLKAYSEIQVWEKHEFDSIIAPVQALPQLPHG